MEQHGACNLSLRQSAYFLWPHWKFCGDPLLTLRSGEKIYLSCYIPLNHMFSCLFYYIAIKQLQLMTAGYNCSFNSHTNLSIHSTFNQLYKSHLMLGILHCYKYYPLSNYMVLRPVAYLVTLKCSVFSACKWTFFFSWIHLLLYAKASFSDCLN